jgi:hypothetical protein
MMQDVIISWYVICICVWTLSILITFLSPLIGHILRTARWYFALSGT